MDQAGELSHTDIQQYPCTLRTLGRRLGTPAVVRRCADSQPSESNDDNKSRMDLTLEFGKRIIDQSLSAWGALNKAVETDVIISDTVVNTKKPSEGRG